MSKRASIYVKHLEVLNPIVVELAQIGARDRAYVNMLNDVENGVNQKDLSQDSELKRVEGSLAHLRLVTLPDGNRLIVKNGSQVFIPKSERKRILETIHLDHMSDQGMIRQTKGKIFWPGMRKQIKETYDHCQPCTENRISRPQKSNKISQKDVFANFYPNEQIEIDFAGKRKQGFSVIS
jgi:hypothetical protein